jgi:hypothetical protein
MLDVEGLKLLLGSGGSCGGAALPPTFTSRPSDCISLISTLKDSGVPASSELSPLTMAS